MSPRHSPDTLADRIQVLMVAEQLTQSDLARTLGWARSGLNRRLNGHTRITVTELQQLAFALSTTASALLTEHAA